MNESEKQYRETLYYEWANKPNTRPNLKEAFEYGFARGAGLIQTEPGPEPVKKEWVLVECIMSYRMRYMVEVPEGKSEWALDTVCLEKAKEFSQLPLGETIVSHRVISEEEALQLCDVDNSYAKSWTEHHKVKSFFTKDGEERYDE